MCPVPGQMDRLRCARPDEDPGQLRVVGQLGFQVFGVCLCVCVPLYR